MRRFVPHNQMTNPRGFRKQDPTQTHGSVKVLLSPKIKNLLNECMDDIQAMLTWVSDDNYRAKFHKDLIRFRQQAQSLEFAVPLAPAPSTGNAQRGTRNEARSLKSSRPPQYRSGR